MKIKHFLFLSQLLLTLNINAQYYNNAAAVFNGTTSYLAVPVSMETELLLTSHQYTIEAWIYPESYTNYPTIVGKNYSTSVWLGLNLNGNIRFYPGAGGFFESDSVVPLNKWSHVAVTFNEAVATIFLNGDSIASTSSLAGPVGNNSDSLFIGCDRDANNNYFFTGKMDMVRLWSKVRTGEQIMQYMHIPLELRGNMTSANFNGLIASYNFDGHGTDWSGYVNDNGVEHDMSWDITGNKISPYVDFNNALILDGNSYATVGLYSDFAATTAITVEAWVCRDRHAPFTNMQDILTKSGPTLSYNYGFSYLTDSSSLIFSTLNLSGGNVRIYKNNVLNDDIWHHIAATYNSTSGIAVLYVDGDSVAGAVYPAHPLILNDGDSLYIGKEGVIGCGMYKFKGMIDEIRIWKDTALSAKQIRNNIFVTCNTFIPPPTLHAGINFGEHTNFVHAGNGAYAALIDFKGNCRISSGHLNDIYKTSPLLFTPFEDIGSNYLIRRSFLDISGTDAADSVFCNDYGTVTSLNLFVLLGTLRPYFHQLSISAPSGTTLDLTGPSSGDLGGKDIMTVFDMSAASSLSGNYGPYSPKVLPINALGNFNNENIHGWWKLNSHQYTTLAETFTLYGWGLHLSFNPLSISESNANGYFLSQNNPNPADNSTVITFTIPHQQQVKFTLKNTLGQIIKVIDDNIFSAGSHDIILIEPDLPTGLYYYTMEAGNFSATKKMLISR